LDVLTLSATPIPRTMYMGMSGIRDMSLMRTPPPRRKSIETMVVEKMNPLVEATMRRELDRSGQIFLVTPRVKDLKELSEWVQTTFPEAKVIAAHGKVKDLELRMHEFSEGNADILLSTTIIESGIDIPTVNTLIVNRADMFGLAQLYQLRGRVGRSAEQAYAIFTYEKSEKVNSVSLKRLYALEEYNELGSSFELAKRDLEIRGAGTLYGIEQSGMIEGVGFDLYMDYLKESVSEWKIVERYIFEDNPKILLSRFDPRFPDELGASRQEQAAILEALKDIKNLRDYEKLIELLNKRYKGQNASSQTFFLWHELWFIARELGIREIRNVEGKHLCLSSRMPQICWQKIIRDALEIGDFIPQAQSRELRTLFMERCKFVEARGLVFRGLGGRPPSAQVKFLTDSLRPLAMAVIQSREEIQEAQSV